MGQLLIELLSEEIPARMQRRAGEALKDLVAEALGGAGLRFESALFYTGPRRIALVVDGLPESQPDTSEERRGPKADAPEKAIEGFLRSAGLTRGDLETRDTGRGAFLFATIEYKGRRTAEILPDLLADAMRRLPWPKSMRWGDGRLRWVRPLHGLLCLLDGEVVPVDLGQGIVAGDRTRGHRFMSPDAFVVGFFADYAATLRHNYVVVDAAERRAMIEDQARKLAEGEGLRLRRDGALLAEVAGLVEWPVCLMGSIDPAFMALPAEVLTTSMRTHQKYFAVEAADGRLAPRFIVVANIEAADGGRAIVAGNERVLRARLADARFFWDQDRKVALADRVPRLSESVFHEKLGTLHERAARIETLATKLAALVPGADLEAVRRAATLAKADLTTEMVGEFPELQGIMGRYYALEEGESPEVADAIAEHYSPAGGGGECPTAPVSVAVALADRLDTLAGFWAIGETPTGSRDPYALRRAALGVIRLVLENELSFGMRAAIAWAQECYPPEIVSRPDDDADRLWTFFVDRLKVHLRDKGVRHDLVAALFARGGDDDLLRLVRKAEALKGFLATEDGANLLTAYRRAHNIVQIEEKKDGRRYDGAADEAKFAQDEERALWRALSDAGRVDPRAADMAVFEDVLKALASLRRSVDAFFDQVTVNVDGDPALRENRLRLLSGITACLNRVADFSEIEG